MQDVRCINALHGARGCSRVQTGLKARSTQHRRAYVSVQAAKTEPSSPWQGVVQQYKGMVQPPAGPQASVSDKPKSPKQPSTRPGKPKSSAPVKAKPVKTTPPTGQRSATQPAAAKKATKPAAVAAKQQQQQQQKPGSTKALQKQDWPVVQAMDAQDMQPSTSGRGSALTAAPPPPVAGGTALTNGRGFGRTAPAAAADADAASQRLRLFAYAVESKRVMAALRECGWDHRFVFTPDLQQAQAIVSCKMTPGGRPQNLVQGERAAVKAGIPFIVLGRVVTKSTVGRALQPLLQKPGSSSSSSSNTNSSSSSSQQNMAELAAQWHAMGAARAAGYGGASGSAR